MSMAELTPISFDDGPIHPRHGHTVIVKPGNIHLPERFKRLASAFYDFEYRSGDIVLMTYPKCGTNWTSNILWAMTHIDELDKLYTHKLARRIHFIDNDYLHDSEIDFFLEQLRIIDPEAAVENGPCLRLAALDQGKRIIWTHLPFGLLNPSVLDKCKVVYVSRNPKDCLFSRFVHGQKAFGSFYSLAHLAEDFMLGQLLFGQFFYHLGEAWQRRAHPNLHIMFYEDMKEDIMGELEKLNVFLGLGLTTDQLKRVSEHTSFTNMKAHPIMALEMHTFHGSFLNQGKVGSSKGILPPDLDARVDSWIEENASKLGLAFKFSA